MYNILVDTHIFNGLHGEFKNVLNCILECCDKIIYSGDILKEYTSRPPPYGLSPRAFILDLESKNKMERKNKNFIKGRFNYLNRIRKYPMPSHSPDHKWIKTAVAVGAKYILTQDPDMTNLVPFRYNHDSTEVIDPTIYVQIRCQD